MAWTLTLNLNEPESHLCPHVTQNGIKARLRDMVRIFLTAKRWHDIASKAISSTANLSTSQNLQPSSLRGEDDVIFYPRASSLRHQSKGTLGDHVA